MDIKKAVDKRTDLLVHCGDLAQQNPIAEYDESPWSYIPGDMPGNGGDEQPAHSVEACCMSVGTDQEAGLSIAPLTAMSTSS